MDLLNNVLGDNYNQLKQELDKQVWLKLDEKIDNINQNIGEDMSIFKQESKEKLNIFARKRKDGDFDILDVDSGESITTIDGVTNVYPVDSSKSCDWDHPKGIVLSKKDVKKLKINIE